MGFEDHWRDLRRDWRTPEPVLRPGEGPRAHLERIVRGAPEVFVRVTGRPKTPRALVDHLRYISREGRLELMDRRGSALVSREEADDLAQAWAFVAKRDTRSTGQTPLGLSVVFGLPEGHEPGLVERASRSFLQRNFEGHDFVQVLHTDRPHPHVHALVRWLGDDGRRLPSHRNVALRWREGFAKEVRALGLEVEASPRWARGVIRRRYPYALHLMREAARAGRGPAPRVDAYAPGTALSGVQAEPAVALPLEIAAARQQLAVRRSYLDLSAALNASMREEDRFLARRLADFVQRMPRP